MSTRTSLRPTAVLNAVDMSTSHNSTPTLLQSLTTMSYQFVWTGTSPVGTITLQTSSNYSLYPTGAVQNSGTWTNVSWQSGGTVISSQAVTGNSGSGIIDITKTGNSAMRVVYTATSGTGSLTVIVTGKVS